MESQPSLHKATIEEGLKIQIMLKQTITKSEKDCFLRDLNQCKNTASTKSIQYAGKAEDASLPPSVSHIA